MATTATNDTIAAIATPPGAGGIGIIRVSGPDALEIMKKIFKPIRARASFQSHVLYHGLLVSRQGVVLDEALGVYMRAPRTYTREDVVEFQSHGSYLVLQAVLGEIFAAGARPADPGEFTKRAFLAGRIDLTRAEAVIDLLRAGTDGGLQLAVGQLQGKLQQEIEAVRDGLVRILAIIEVAIDFPEDDVEILARDELSGRLRQEVEQPLTRLLAMADQGALIREGVKAVIAGRPNVGKSSLLNALLREDRALVTALPGTTRDTIEEVIAIGSIPVRLVDTAGIRDGADLIEELGIDRARRKMAEADVVLFMLDAAEGFTEVDRRLYDSIDNEKRIVVINKVDKAGAGKIANLEETFRRDGALVVKISARELLGLEDLQDAMYHKIVGDESLQELASCAPNVRHRSCLEKALASTRRLLGALEDGLPADLAAVELQAALDDLGDIVGLTTADDVLDRIFAEFCIGK